MVNELSDSRLPSDLKELLVVDAAESDQEEGVVPVNPILPQMFDAHFNKGSLEKVWRT